MICRLCRAIADHPSKTPSQLMRELRLRCEPGCTSQHMSIKTPVEQLYDPMKVDLEWVRTHRIINSSK